MTYYAVGDIHGRADLLTKMLDKIKNDMFFYESEEYPTVVFVGDYIDRGAGSKQVIDMLWEFEKWCNDVGASVVFLKGNHEDMCLSPNQFMWLVNGGTATKSSFGGEIPQKYLDWMKNLKLYFETDDYFFVHAGVSNNRKPSEASEDTMLWIRESFLNSTYDWGKLIIHGHTPVKNVTIRPNRINIDTGAVFYGTLTCVVLEKDKEPIFIQVKEKE